ncbi:MAG: HTTM domain-containing protein [Myxococcota bacterium]
MIRWVAGTWMWWVERFSTTEAPTALALVRIAVILVVLWDLGMVGWLDLPELLWAPVEAGGSANVYKFKVLPEWFWFLPQESAPEWGHVWAWALYYAIVVSAACFGAGILTRFSGLCFLLLFAQSAIINDTADRGIDRMIRIIVLLLILSGSGKTLSLDALFRTGSIFGDGSKVLAFPRYLIIGQLILMYWCAGIAKFAISWFPWGGYSALYVILQDPIFAVRDWSMLGSPWLYWTTQVGTAVSHMWEYTIPVLLLAYWFRTTRERSGALRATFNALDIRTIYVVVGMTFHIALAGSLRLGIFPAAMLALYPAFFHPDEILGIVRRFGRAK